MKEIKLICNRVHNTQYPNLVIKGHWRRVKAILQMRFIVLEVSYCKGDGFDI